MNTDYGVVNWVHDARRFNLFAATTALVNAVQCWHMLGSHAVPAGAGDDEAQPAAATAPLSFRRAGWACHGPFRLYHLSGPEFLTD
eukprot:COSAG01_NODE_160_length_23692_cov_9.703599_26_plen_86_part_00